MRPDRLPRALRSGLMYGSLSGAYLSLAIVFTWPLILHVGSHTPAADASGDQFQTIWFFWWLKKAVFELHQNPYWTDWIYYPYGTGLGYHLSPFTGLCALALSAVSGAAVNGAAIYNTLVFASFVAAGLGSFALLRRVTDNASVAFWGSILVVVSPYRLWHLNHLNLLSIGWSLFAIHFALRAWEQPQKRWMLLASLFAGATFYTSLSDFSFIVFFLAGHAALRAREAWSCPDRMQTLKITIVGCVVVAAVVAPGIFELKQAAVDAKPTWEQAERFSANLMYEILPGATTSLAGLWTRGQAGIAPRVGGETFLGWLLPFLAVVVLWRRGRQTPARWLLLAAIFQILALGPTLRIGEHRFLAGMLPYRWLFEVVPYLNMSRAPSRFLVLTHLCLTVYVAQGVALWFPRARDALRRTRRAAFGAAATVGIVAVLFVEGTNGDIKLWPVTTPDLYRTVAKDSTIRAIAEMPFIDYGPYCNLYMYWQTVHERKVANGYLTYHSRTARTLMDRVESPLALIAADSSTLRDAGIDAVVTHRRTGDCNLQRLR